MSGDPFRTGNSVSAVLVDRSAGEYLHYEIEVEGAGPNFSFECAHRHVLSSATMDRPMHSYKWDWLRAAADSDAVDDFYLVSMIFDAVVTRYRLVIEHRAGNDSVIALLTDLVFQTNDPKHLPARQVLQVSVK